MAKKRTEPVNEDNRISVRMSTEVKKWYQEFQYFDPVLGLDINPEASLSVKLRQIPRILDAQDLELDVLRNAKVGELRDMNELNARIAARLEARK